ncbi:hypothetical protein D3C73_1422790 [compost metagenome]
MIGKLLQLRSASCDGEIVEVRERPDMLPNRVIGRVLLVERLDVALDLRAQPQGLDAVNRLERPKVMFQHDNHLSRKAKEMSCCAWPAVMCPDAGPESLIYAGVATFGHIRKRGT